MLFKKAFQTHEIFAKFKYANQKYHTSLPSVLKMYNCALTSHHSAHLNPFAYINWMEQQSCEHAFTSDTCLLEQFLANKAINLIIKMCSSKVLCANTSWQPAPFSSTTFCKQKVFHTFSLNSLYCLTLVLRKYLSFIINSLQVLRCSGKEIALAWLYLLWISQIALYCV